LSKLKWLLEKLADVAFDVIAGYLLYLIIGGYISQPLSELHPYLPTVLAASLIISIVVGFLYRFYKSIRFHRFIERVSSSLIDFLRNWDNLKNAMDKAIQSQNQQAIKEFEDIRTKLQYDYVAQDIISVVKVMKYERIDLILGVHIRNYDVIGNLLMESPFVKIRNWLGADYIYRVFLRD